MHADRRNYPMTSKPTLLILAAGKGTRYGGLKQLEPVGPYGQTIIDYSIFDAVRAGFEKIVFVIRAETEKAFREKFNGITDTIVPIEYVFQQTELPEKFQHLNLKRNKPWGTAHAVWSAADKINEAFAVINADDFYGRQAFESMASFFQQKTGKYALIGYPLHRTLSEHGTVSRGICQVDANNQLVKITEHTKIEKKNGKIISHFNGRIIELDRNETVSMNFWGFLPDIFPHLEREFMDFLSKNIHHPEKEFYIPSVVNKIVENHIKKVSVLPGGSLWAGITYKQDKRRLEQTLEKLINQKIYPEKLWTIK